MIQLNNFIMRLGKMVWEISYSGKSVDIYNAWHYIIQGYPIWELPTIYNPGELFFHACY